VKLDNACGVGDYENYPYLYFYNTKQNSNGMWATICVSECPSEGDTSIACGVNTIITDCSDSDIIIYDTYPCIFFEILRSFEVFYYRYGIYMSTD